MKKTVLVRTICTCLAVCTFAGMAMASGSSSGSRETGSVTIGDDTTKSTEETTKATEAKVDYEVTKTTFKHYTNSIGREEYVGIVEIKNTGTCVLYLEDCTFDFEDDDGHLLQSDKLVSSLPDVIAPGEVGYFYHDGFIDQTVSLENGINLVPNFVVEECRQGDSAVVEYEVTDLDIRDADYGLGVKVTGRVINNTEEETTYYGIQVIVVFYDSDGEIMDIGCRLLDPMSPGAKASFEVSTVFGNEEVSVDTVSDYKVIARKSYSQL